MFFNTLLGKGIATGTLAALTAGGIYGICVAQRIASVDARRIKRTQTITSELHQSPTIRDYANPRDHVSISDTRTYTFTLPPHHQHVVSDRLLLARCIRAFYGGLVLGPERTILSLRGIKITDYPKAPAQTVMWSRDELPTTEPPPLSTVIFGGFQVLDINIAESEDESHVSHSHVDLIFGKPESQFSGAQRFAITRARPESGPQTVQVSFESLACNPSVNKLGFLRYLGWFHDLYAELLFRETVASVTRSLETDEANWISKLLGLTW